MCHRGSFRDDIYKKCVLCKADNGLKHVVNECAKLKNERKQLLKDLTLWHLLVQGPLHLNMDM